MAKIVDPDSVPWYNQDGHSRYPWLQWFNGQVWALVPGQDFTEDVKLFRQICHRKARTWVQVRTRFTGGVFYLQAFELEP